MNLQHRIDLIVQLGDYMVSQDERWLQAQELAFRENGWFIPEFIQLAVKNITESFLQRPLLEAWIAAYGLEEEKTGARSEVGLVMAGNIPLVGFHDLLCVFISGHRVRIKLSARDRVLTEHLVQFLIEKAPEIAETIRFDEMLKGCDAYIATGSNNSARYFEQYFSRFPHIIRRNRTSVAILTGNESQEELELLADDVMLFFGLGCRNVTKIYVPENYSFEPLLKAFDKYAALADHNKFKNNYDYNLALYILNKQYYMTNGTILLVKGSSPFSPVSQLSYEYYIGEEDVIVTLKGNPDIQAIAGAGHLPFGAAQSPSLTDYADGEDTMAFLRKLRGKLTASGCF